MSDSETIFVIGHRNPDMDAIASAMGYAWLLNHQSGGKAKYEAGRTGEVNKQTAFALDRFKAEAPYFVADMYRRVRDLTEPIAALQRGQNLLTAIQHIAQTRRPAAVLDADAKPIGLLSGEMLFGSLAEALSSTSVLALAKSLDQPVETAVEQAGLMLSSGERIRDVVGQVLRDAQDEFIVIDENGKYIGLCRKSALLAPPRSKLIIVDHNEPQQAVPGIEDAELLEVLDHHRLGNLPTSIPIRFRVEPVGSCSTLVAESAVDAEVTLPPALSGLMLCGILSDTLVLRSPTTTQRDIRAAKTLAAWAQLTEPDTQEAIEALGKELLSAGAGLGERAAEEIINADLKFYEQNGLSAGIAQVEVTTFSEIAPRLADLRLGLAGLAEQRKLTLAMLMVTDVVRGNSVLIVEGQPRLVASLPYRRRDDGTLDAPGVVSRKKQLLPAVLAALAQSV